MSGCSNSGSGSPPPAASSSTPPAPAAPTMDPTLASIQAQVFTPTCAISGCHAGGTAPHGLDLTAGNSFGNLVNVASGEIPALMRVAPGDPDNSYIVQKIEGTAAAGGRMPANGPPYLSIETIAAIRQWITDGALVSSAGSPSITVASLTSPSANAELQQSPAYISLAFNNEINASEVSSATVQLLASGGDNSFVEGNEYLIQPNTVSVSANNPYVVVMDLAGITLSSDRYQVIAKGDGDLVLLNLTGVAIDGNADSIPGGNFYSEFSINASNK